MPNADFRVPNGRSSCPEDAGSEGPISDLSAVVPQSGTKADCRMQLARRRRDCGMRNVDCTCGTSGDGRRPCLDCVHQCLPALRSSATTAGGEESVVPSEMKKRTQFVVSCSGEKVCSHHPCECGSGCGPICVHPGRGTPRHPRSSVVNQK